jgi:hypothetical protein
MKVNVRIFVEVEETVEKVIRLKGLRPCGSTHWQIGLLEGEQCSRRIYPQVEWWRGSRHRDPFEP